MTQWRLTLTQVPALFKDRKVASEALGPERWGALEYIESLWPRFVPYADKWFLPEFQRAVELMHAASKPGPAFDGACAALQQRYWEMYLVCSLLDRGIKLIPHAERPAAGPDILAGIDSCRTWIECVVPGRGAGPDAIPDFPDMIAHDVPDDAIKLRLLAALDEKRKKFAKYVEDGIVKGEDAQVIAINGRGIPYASTDFDPPRIARVLYGLGNIAVPFNLETNSWGKEYVTRQTEVAKKEGKPVPSGLFAEQSASNLTGVLYSCLDAWNRVADDKADLLYLPNPRATVKLPEGWLTRCAHYSITSDGRMGTITRTVL